MGFHMCSSNFEKAYGCVPQGVLWGGTGSAVTAHSGRTLVTLPAATVGLSFLTVHKHYGQTLHWVSVCLVNREQSLIPTSFGWRRSSSTLVVWASIWDASQVGYFRHVQTGWASWADPGPAGGIISLGWIGISPTQSHFCLFVVVNLVLQ